MLAELAAANAAFAIIKQTIANGRELASAGKAISDFVHAEDELKQRGNKKKNSFWRKVGGEQGNDLEEFMALEQIRTKKAELEQAMIYYGRAGLHADWVRFQVEARKRRQKEAIERERKREELLEIIGISLLVVVILCGVAWLSWMVYIAKQG